MRFTMLIRRFLLAGGVVLLAHSLTAAQVGTPYAVRATAAIDVDGVSLNIHHAITNLYVLENEKDATGTSWVPTPAALVAEVGGKRIASNRSFTAAGKPVTVEYRSTDATIIAIDNDKHPGSFRVLKPGTATILVTARPTTVAFPLTVVGLPFPRFATAARIVAALGEPIKKIRSGRNETWFYAKYPDAGFVMRDGKELVSVTSDGWLPLRSGDFKNIRKQYDASLDQTAQPAR